MQCIPDVGQIELVFINSMHDIKRSVVSFYGKFTYVPEKMYLNGFGITYHSKIDLTWARPVWFVMDPSVQFYEIAKKLAMDFCCFFLTLHDDTILNKNSSLCSKRSCSKEERTQTIFCKLAAPKLGQETEGTLARRPPIFENPLPFLDMRWLASYQQISQSRTTLLTHVVLRQNKPRHRGDTERSLQNLSVWF